MGKDPGFPLENTNPPPAPTIPENYSKITIWPTGPVLKIAEKLLRRVIF